MDINVLGKGKGTKKSNNNAFRAPTIYWVVRVVRIIIGPPSYRGGNGGSER